MTNFITETRALLTTILTTLKDDNTKALKAVVDSIDPTEVSLKPAAGVERNSFDNDFYSTAANNRKLHFTIRTFVSGSDNALAAEDSDIVMQEIVNAIDSDPTLGGQVLSTICTKAGRDDELTTEDMRVDFIEVDVEILVNR